MVVDLRKARVRARLEGGAVKAQLLLATRLESAPSGKLSKNADEEILVVFLISSSTPSMKEGLRFL